MSGATWPPAWLAEHDSQLARAADPVPVPVPVVQPVELPDAELSEADADDELLDPATLDIACDCGQSVDPWQDHAGRWRCSTCWPSRRDLVADAARLRRLSPPRRAKAVAAAVPGVVLASELTS